MLQQLVTENMLATYKRQRRYISDHWTRNQSIHVSTHLRWEAPTGQRHRWLNWVTKNKCKALAGELGLRGHHLPLMCAPSLTQLSLSTGALVLVAVTIMSASVTASCADRHASPPNSSAHFIVLSIVRLHTLTWKIDTTKLGAFVWSGFGIWKPVSDAFSVPLLKSAPEKRIFTNHVPSTASQSEFDHVTRIPCLKIGVLVYTVSRWSKCKANYQSLIYFMVVSLLWTDCTNFLSLGKRLWWERTTQMWLKPLALFNCTFLFVWWGLKHCFWVLNHADTPIKDNYK